MIGSLMIANVSSRGNVKVFPNRQDQRRDAITAVYRFVMFAYLYLSSANNICGRRDEGSARAVVYRQIIAREDHS